MSELLQGSALDARQRGQVDAIRRAGEHLLRLVNDALDLARIEAGKLQLTNTDFLLRPLLDEVAGLMAPVAERKGLVFVDGIAPVSYTHLDVYKRQGGHHQRLGAFARRDFRNRGIAGRRRPADDLFAGHPIRWGMGGRRAGHLAAY